MMSVNEDAITVNRKGCTRCPNKWGTAYYLKM